jgi:hypothetical protein
VLRDVTLSVPPFQRNYSWTVEQIDEYWFDLRVALSSAQPYYFMGTVVVSRESSSSAIVIDGQQRLATTSLLLAAIRDAFASGNEASRAAAIQNRYLTTWSLEENAEGPRLDLNDADRGYFTDAVLRGQTSVPSARRPLLESAYSQLSRRVTEEVEAAGPHWAEKLLQWVEFLDRRAQVIFMETANDGDAFMVFETLNDRGLPLAVADVIKNYLLSVARGRLDEASALWLSAVETIEEGGGRDELTSYIRHWWNSRRGATRERDLYTFIRNAVRSEDQSLSALQDLDHRAPAYAALTDPSHFFWEQQEQPARQAASILLDLGLEQYRPLALAVLSELPPSLASEVLGDTVSWSVRALIAGGAGGGTAERLYSEAAVRVSNGRSVDLESVWSDIRPLVPSDAEFSASFASRKIHRLGTLRYLLRALAEKSKLPSRTEGLVPVPLIPRKDPEGLWRDVITADEMADAAGRLGNFVLVERNAVKSLPQQPDERFRRLEDAASRVGGLIVPWDEPTIADVERRQLAMAEMAIGIWSLPTSKAKSVS